MPIDFGLSQLHAANRYVCVLLGSTKMAFPSAFVTSRNFTQNSFPINKEIDQKFVENCTASQLKFPSKRNDYMMNEELELLLRFPLMSKQVIEENKKEIYLGSVYVNNEEYQLAVIASTNLTSLYLPKKLVPFKNEIQNTVQASGAVNILKILETICSFVSTNLPGQKLVNNCDIYRDVLNEYWNLTNSCLNLKSCSLAHDLGKINLSFMDEQNREHSAEISVNFEGSMDEIFSVTRHDIPKTSFEASKSLKVLFDQLVKTVETLQSYYCLMEIFDERCWVLDPIHPKKCDVFRRICIGDNLSILVTVDPFNITRIPEIRFIGLEKLVEKYRTTLNENLTEWCPQNDVYLEILKLLGMDAFPGKVVDPAQAFDNVDESGECSICFSLRLNDKLPEVVCKNDSCATHYHAECLYEWLISANARKFFQEVFGVCPSCEKAITCPIPS